MPNSKKYQSIKNNPIRLEHKRKQNSEWIKKKRIRYPFSHYSKDFHHRKKVEITPFQFWCIAKKQKLICPLTGRKLNGDKMSVDHILPLSRGGTNDISNLQFVHIDANYAKRSMTNEEFIQMCREVVSYH